MSATITSLAASAVPAAVGARATQGALWTIFFSGLTKLATLGTQIALAWFLAPAQFGQVATVLSVMSLTAAVGSGNFKNILIQRQHRFEAEAGQVFWLALTVNLGASAILGMTSFSLESWFDQAGVGALLLVAALALPLQALSTVHSAVILKELRFRRIAAIQFGASVIQNGIALYLAWLGFGAFALIWPLSLVALWNALASRHSSGPVRLGWPKPGVWWSLAAPFLWLMLHTLFSGAIVSGPSLIMGAAGRDSATIGFYYWGFSLSSQAVFLLVANLQGVLFPALIKLNDDPGRQLSAFDKTARSLMAVIVPVCLLQMLLAGPVISVVFGSKWAPSIEVVQWISLGLLTQPFSLLATSLLLARGKLRRLAGMSAGLAAAIVLAAWVGARAGDQADVARWVSFTTIAGNLWIGFVACRELNCSAKRLAIALLPVAGVGIAVGLLAWSVARATSPFGVGWQVAMTVLSALLAYAALIRTFIPDLAADVLARLNRRVHQGVDGRFS